MLEDGIQWSHSYFDSLALWQITAVIALRVFDDAKGSEDNSTQPIVREMRNKAAGNGFMGHTLMDESMKSLSS